MVSIERSKKKVQLWKKAIVHFLLCFVMGFFTGFAPTGKGSLFSTRNSAIPKITQSNQTQPNMLYHSRLESETFNKPLLDETTTTIATTTIASEWSNLNDTRHSEKVLEEEEEEEEGEERHEQEQNQDQDQDQEREEANGEFLNPRRLLIIVTPTSAKDQNRGMLLRRLSNTLRLIPQPILWVVVEQQNEDSNVSEILRKTGIMYRHLVFKENFTNIHEEVDHQRNVALNHIEHHKLSGIVHFASLSNVYDLSFFDQLRAIEGFGTWPMALLSANKKEVIIEGPVCDSSEVMGWHLKKANNSTDERPPIRVSSVAFNSSILWDPERWGRTSSIQDTSQDSLKFVRKEVLEDETKLMGIPPNDCSKILLWNLPLST
ncbi:beta-1,4-xylosyltransferase IRX9 [Nicotiana sylvestris]|uniref:Glycosyltransferases n=1 Tax=Nicotiana sylvestris TaxID=4096 RepID=A0A1U7XCZ4_NICSY|nr:PREDICTED: probable beta-1,4-xylosyltransferase IRX9 [Nicotiana sylvestris]